MYLTTVLTKQKKPTIRVLIKSYCQFKLLPNYSLSCAKQTDFKWKFIKNDTQYYPHENKYSPFNEVNIQGYITIYKTSINEDQPRQENEYQ